MQILTNLDLNNNQLLNAVIQKLASAPVGVPTGFIYYNTSDDTLYVNTTTGWEKLNEDAVTTVAANSPLSVTVNGTQYTISIQPATGSQDGYMLAADKAKLDAATNLATANTLVMRNEFGDADFANITANTVYASLSGNASTASKLQTARTITLSGKVSGSTTFDGSANVTINTTVSLVAADISDFNNAVQANRLDQMAAPTAAVSMNGQNLTNLADPVNAQDAATKSYVDATRMGLDFKESVRVATTGNIDVLSAPSSIDGVTLNNGDRVLVKDQLTASENGIYVYNGVAVPMSRAADADTDAEVTSGMFVFVEEGSTNADSGWVLSTDDPITLGTTGLTFVQFSGAGQIIAGAGLSKTGNQLDVNVYSGTGAGLGQTVISGDAIAVKLGTGANDAAAGNHTHTISALSDVSASTPSNSDVLQYLSGTGKWTSRPLTSVLPGAINTVLTTNLTANRVVISNSGGKLATSAVTDTELSFLSGVTSSIQPQIDARTRKFSQTIGDGTTTTFSIAHSLGTKQVVVSIYNTTTEEEVITDVTRVDVNTIQVSFATAPATGEYEVVVVG